MHYNDVFACLMPSSDPNECTVKNNCYICNPKDSPLSNEFSQQTQVFIRTFVAGQNMKSPDRQTPPLATFRLSPHCCHVLILPHSQLSESVLTPHFNQAINNNQHTLRLSQTWGEIKETHKITFQDVLQLI